MRLTVPVSRNMSSRYCIVLEQLYPSFVEGRLHLISRLGNDAALWYLITVMANHRKAGKVFQFNASFIISINLRTLVHRLQLLIYESVIHKVYMLERFLRVRPTTAPTSY